MINAFILMPFQETFDAIYTFIIKTEVEKYNGAVCLRADEIYTSTSIIHDIVSKIKESDFLIADLTDKNPNVLYELGYSHCLNKPVILITQNINDIPFDIRDKRIIEYSDNAPGLEKLKNQLSEHIKVLVNKLKDNSQNDEEDNFYLDGELVRLNDSLKKLRKKKEQLKAIKRFEESVKVDFWAVETYSQLRKKCGNDLWKMQSYIDVLKYFDQMDELKNPDVIDHIVVPMAFLGGIRGSEANTARHVLKKLSVTGPFSISKEDFIEERKQLERDIKIEEIELNKI